MARISDLSDELLVKILSYLPTKVAVSTSVLSKQWESLWMWSPKLEYDDYSDITDINTSSLLRYRGFIAKNLPLHRAPIIESLLLRFCGESVQPDYIKSLAEIAVSRCVRELSIGYFPFFEELAVLLPTSLYTCKTLVTLKLSGPNILVDVTHMVCLPSLKTLELVRVTYSNDDSLRLLICYNPLLEDLTIQRDNDNDNIGGMLLVSIPSLLRLSLTTGVDCYFDAYIINTPSLKYFKVRDYRNFFTYVMEHMPQLEEADIVVKRNPEELLESITSAKRLSLELFFNSEEEPEYHAGIVFNRLEHLKLYISNGRWSKLLASLLKDSPKLRVLNLGVDRFLRTEHYELDSWNSERSSVPKCLLDSLETFEFKGYKGRPEERDFLSYISKHAHRLKSWSILP